MFFKYFFAMLIALNLSHAYAEDKENYLKNQMPIGQEETRKTLLLFSQKKTIKLVIL